MFVTSYTNEVIVQLNSYYIEYVLSPAKSIRIYLHIKNKKKQRINHRAPTFLYYEVRRGTKALLTFGLTSQRATPTPFSKMRIETHTFHWFHGFVKNCYIICSSMDFFSLQACYIGMSRDETTMLYHYVTGCALKETVSMSVCS